MTTHSTTTTLDSPIGTKGGKHEAVDNITTLTPELDPTDGTLRFTYEWQGKQLPLHDHLDCLRVVAGYDRATNLATVKLCFPNGTDSQGSHVVLGTMNVYVNGTVVLSGWEWDESIVHDPTQLPIENMAIRYADEAVWIDLSQLRKGDEARFQFTKLVVLAPDGSRIEYKHGDPNVVIRIIRTPDEPSASDWPDCPS